MAERSKAEENFIDRMARHQLVQWAHAQIQGEPFFIRQIGQTVTPYAEHAITKGWLNKDGTKVLAKGFMTATAVLKGSSPSNWSPG